MTIYTTKQIGETKFSLLRKSIKRNYLLYILLILPMMYFFLFKYVPMAGIILSFRNYVPGQSIFGENWVGFKYFSIFLTDPTFWNIFKNTILLSLLNLIIGFPIPIIFALLLNEVRNNNLKRFIQTVSYLPKFFSTVVVVALINSLLSPSTGIVNNILELFGKESIYFVNDENWFRPIYIISEIWQFTGWNAILYIAALASVDMELYEAAVIDGANRWKQTLYITIPEIMPTIVILFIMSVGYVLTVGFEKILLLYSPNIYGTADVIQTFVYRMGIVNNNYSYATAVGLFQSVISLALLWGTNQMAKRYSEYSLW